MRTSPRDGIASRILSCHECQVGILFCFIGVLDARVGLGGAPLDGLWIRAEDLNSLLSMA